MKTTICFFDLDATIMVNPFASAVWPVITRELAVLTGLSPKVLRHAIETENLRRQHDDPNNPLTMDWDDIVATTARQHTVRLSVSVLELVEQNCKPPHIAVLDDAISVLQSLQAPERKFVVASKGLSKYQMPVLKALGLFHLFDDYLMPDLTGYLKTDPRFYARYTNDPEDMLFIQVGDHHYDDVIIPKQLGFRTIMRAPIPDLADINPFKRPRHLSTYHSLIHTFREDAGTILPDAVVIDLGELDHVIEKIESQAGIHSQH